MPQALIAGLPPELNLAAGCVVRLTALDPTTGNAVTGVVVTSFSLYVNNVGGGPDSQLVSGPFMLVPGPGN